MKIPIKIGMKNWNKSECVRMVQCSTFDLSLNVERTHRLKTPR